MRTATCRGALVAPPSAPPPPDGGGGTLGVGCFSVAPPQMCQYLHFCTSKASKLTLGVGCFSVAPPQECQYLHFCTSKASKLSTWRCGCGCVGGLKMCVHIYRGRHARRGGAENVYACIHLWGGCHALRGGPERQQVSPLRHP